MANDKKFIVKNGVVAPSVEFANNGSSISATYLNASNTLSITGNTGTLISVTDTASRKVSIPGTLEINALSANGSLGTAGYALVSNGSSTYWSMNPGYTGSAGYVGSIGYTGSKGISYVGNTAPLNPVNGDTWWNNEVGIRYVYYSDGDSSQWVQESAVGPKGTVGYTGSSAPYPAAGIPVSTGTAWDISKTAPTGDVVGTTDTQTLTNKTIESGSFTNGYTEEVYSLAGTQINPINGSIQTKTLGGNTTFTEAINDGQSVVLMLNPSTFTTTWPTVSWVSAAGTPSTPPTLKASVMNTIILWRVSGTLYGLWAGSV